MSLDILSKRIYIVTAHPHSDT